MINFKSIYQVLLFAAALIFSYNLLPADAQTCTDNDGDTYAVEGGACGAEDCDDTDADVHPGAAEICDGKDTDCDGWTPPADVDADGDGVAECAGDCDDNDADINPGAAEICLDGKDNNCNFLTDEAGCVCPDTDEDGYPDAACGGTDCDDSDSAINPGVAENCSDLADNDCDGLTDGNDTDCIFTCIDNDGDGYGDPGNPDCDNGSALDCDDTNAAVFPGAVEVCNGIDDNCDGNIDESADADGDGYTICEGDCDDSDEYINPAAAEIIDDRIDQDCDGEDRCYEDNDEDNYGSTTETDDVDGDLDCSTGTTVSGNSIDCDDSNADVNPDAAEICNAIDDNCDGNIDESADADGDGYTICDGDCDDTEVTVYPGASEICDGLDNDCDSQVPVDEQDIDTDGYFVCSVVDPDCDDNNGAVNPGAAELCNSIDDNCDGNIDESADADGDGYTICDGDCDDTNDEVNPGAAEICDGVDTNCDGWKPPSDVDNDGDGVAQCDMDCDDSDADIYPGATEICGDGIDNNCNGINDEGGCTCPDADGDGETAAYCGGTDCDDTNPNLQTHCPGCTDSDGDGRAVEGGNCGPVDCDDTDANVYPGAPEICDGKDSDCDGWRPPSDVDVDGDEIPVCAGDCNDNHLGVYPGATEQCDGLDNDCNGLLRSDEHDTDGDGYFICGVESDCNDTDAAINPGAAEDCSDGIDNDCDGLVDMQDPNAQNCPACTDSDGDEYYTEGGACGDVDCDDSDAGVHPGAAEICDGKDTDCDGWKPSTDVDGDGDGYAVCAGDCDDTDNGINPGAAELCDGIDNNCDAEVDEAGCLCPDADIDNDGEDSTYCGGTDCDDNDAAVNTAAVEDCGDGIDNDCDGLVDMQDPNAQNCPACTDSDGDEYYTEGGACGDVDCDDSDANVHPGAAEICDGKDTDCDGWKPSTDVDGDGDGVEECKNDCNDNDISVYPGAPEVCDGKDNNCDYIVPFAERDLDGDGYLSCDAVTPDCDDNDALTNPGQPEWCSDGKDNNCDGEVDEAGCICPDADNDGYTASFCGGTDCNDAEATVYPGAVEECTDGLDNDCDGLTDCADPDAQNCPPITDADNDGYDVDGVCGDADCDDSDATVYPGAVEACDGKDTDCDGWKPFSDTDSDGDGVAVCANDCDDNNDQVYPGNKEGNINDPSCSDGYDNDCDYQIDGVDTGCFPASCETGTTPKQGPHFVTLLNPDDSVHPEAAVMHCEKCHAPDYADPLRFACQRCHADPADTSDPLNGTLKAQYPLDPPYGYGTAPNVQMHTSSVVGTQYGNWSMGPTGCVACHNPHTQEQDNAFGTGYGKYVKEYICLDNPVTGLTIEEYVEFTSSGGAGSFADGAPNNENICEMCHTQTNYHKNDGTAAAHYDGAACTDCHLHSNGFAHGSGAAGGSSCGDANTCHGTVKSHATHFGGTIDPIDCDTCHDTNNFPAFKTGTGSAPYDLSKTDVCDGCHSVDGAQIAKDPVKDYWGNPGSSIMAAGSWAVVEGEESFCGSCHDASPGYNAADEARNIMGNNSTYGFYVTGHGKSTGTYAPLSWQETSEDGNPAANLGVCGQCHGTPPVDGNGFPIIPDPPSVPRITACSFCHDLTAQHYDSPDKRLRAGFENDQDNTNCKQCHSSDMSEGTAATSSPHFYTTSADYENSAHEGSLCTECHDVHGAAGAFTAMARANQEDLCYQCHTEGVVQNNAISGADLADDIEQAFMLSDKHNLGTDYTIGSSNYKLECVSCHNVHLVSGKFWEADQDRSPVSMISTPSSPQGNLQVWGDDAGEKMDDFAALGPGTGGTYRTPDGDLFSGAELPDYASFCLECHAQAGDPPFGLDWINRPHGLQSANSPNGGGTCPDWYGCGKAHNWDGDNCIPDDGGGSDADCWPVQTRAYGDQIFSRKPYYHDERIAGANFTLSCTDCHEAHGSNVRSMIRDEVNDWGPGSGTWIWNTMCNNCHYYYSDWHAGMSCGTASCHVSDSIHRMGAYTGSQATRTFDSDLVVDMRFDNNLNDSGTWRMHGVWSDTAGSFAAGKNGQALYVNDTPIEVGTRNAYWSTDEGRHGTWKFTEMKYNMTLESWIYPTDDTGTERRIMAKHTYGTGGYKLEIKKIRGTWRAALLTNINGGGGADCGGLRGAFSTVTIPLNEWTHVAATYDHTLPDRNPADGSVGRVRIYVNGEDVTDSYPDDTQCYTQPGTGEEAMFPHSDWNDIDPVNNCYVGHWCASALSIGGMNWSDPNVNFIGRIDEAKVWNITKDVTYFALIDAAVAPKIVSVTVNTPDTLLVSFSEGVIGSGTGNELIPSDFTLSCGGKTIVDVQHTAGGTSAIVTLSAPLVPADIGVCTLGAAGSSVFDDYNNPVGTGALPITGSLCPDPGVFQLNEPAGSATAQDDLAYVTGTVFNPPGSFTGDGYFHGDAANNYILFSDADKCFKADTALTLEARFMPTGIPNDDSNHIQRIFNKVGDNYQISVWRNETAAWKPPFDPPSDTVVLAFWTKPVDAHGGAAWKTLKTDYNVCPIKNDHWYQVKLVWNSAKTGGIPGDIFVDDQGTDGNGAGENWADFINCTDSAQAQTTADRLFVEGDVMISEDGDSSIGAKDNGGLKFNGLIDWIKVKSIVDYSGVDDTPNPPQ